MNQPLFETGTIVATSGVFDLMMKQDGLDVTPYLYRHTQGDWGDLSPEDQDMNNQALFLENRIFSAYETEYGRIWIITEWDRSITTVLLPEEY